MYARLKGINTVRKRLADGSIRIYRYAGRDTDAPRLEGAPGTAEFQASLAAAGAKRKPQRDKTLQALINYFQTTTEFTHGISERTRADYVKQIMVIERTWGGFPVSGLNDKRARGLFMEWRDKLAQKSVRQADYAWTVLARILSVALKRGKIDVNPCVAGDRLYRSARVDKVWTEEDEAAFLNSAPTHLRLPLILALWTGQREGDLLRLTWAAYDGSVIRLRPRKTITRKSPQGKTVIVPVGVLAHEGSGEASPLKAALDAAAREKLSPVILLSSEGRPWTEDGFRASFRKACIKAGVVGLTFMI